MDPRREPEPALPPEVGVELRSSAMPLVMVVVLCITIDILDTGNRKAHSDLTVDQGHFNKAVNI